MTSFFHTVSIVAALFTSDADGGLPQVRHLAQSDTPLQIPQPATPDAGTTQPSPPAAAGAAPEQPSEPQAGPDNGPPPDENAAPDDEGSTPDDLSLGEIPIIETMELTPEVARRALDSYIVTKEKYADSDLEQYENLQDFVDQTEDGKKFEADIKAAGFANVSDWNLAITTLGIVYGSLIDDQTADLKLQVQEIEADSELAQDIKDRMVKALQAMIPSENNKKVVEEMMADPVYGPKLKQLDIEEE